MLASTISSASLTPSSAGPDKGERGRAIRPVLADSRIPKGAISFRNESIRVGFAELHYGVSMISTINQCKEMSLTPQRYSCCC